MQISSPKVLRIKKSFTFTPSTAAGLYDLDWIYQDELDILDTGKQGELLSISVDLNSSPAGSAYKLSSIALIIANHDMSTLITSPSRTSYRSNYGPDAKNIIYHSGVVPVQSGVTQDKYFPAFKVDFVAPIPYTNETGSLSPLSIGFLAQGKTTPNVSANILITYRRSR